MVEEVKRQMGRFENLIGFEGKSDVGSKSFIQELIRSLSEKYKKDVHSSIRLHQLEFFYDLIENSRRKQQKALVEEEDDFQPERKRAAAEADEEAPEVEKKVEEKKPDDIVSVDAKDIDDWKDLMTLSKIYYVLEHPKSQGLTWKRRITKKKSITKFTDRDLIEWRVAQHFRLRGLEEWAQSRSDARQMAQESPYDFDGIDEESETKEIEDMFNIFATTKKKKPKITTKKQEKTIKTSRPFKFTDETIEDWTESYSDDSDDMETLEAAEEIIEGPDGEPKDDKLEEQESSFDEEECISEIFSNYQKIEKYRQPIFDEMDRAEVTIKKPLHLSTLIHFKQFYLVSQKFKEKKITF
ncbi:uncharacterized protein LOC129223194 [Uloborus diversus]|uniref:uncharacterized protein LOC129223194 n=1 Tax=Uloborus diversus TaxID=327109 RepID=UPI002409DEF8|nr:uncharacterized protein LOC129223194 [Uloborus diversus]